MQCRFIIISLVLSVSTGMAQYAPIKVLLRNDSVILTKYAYLANNSTSGRFGPHVVINHKDGPKIPISKIHHVEGNDRSGKLRYFTVATFQGLEIFAERIHDGERIDLYLNNVVTGGWDFRYTMKLLHYSKDDGEIKKARYPNLRRDLKDSPEAMSKLRAGNAIKISQYLLYGLGAYILVNSAVKESEEPMTPPGTDPGIPTGFLVGAGILFVPWMINGLKLKQYEQACKEYR